MGIKITFDTNIWRALGPKGISKLDAHLNNSNPSKVEIWETPPGLFESTFDWLKDGRYDMAIKTAKNKEALCCGRILPAPAVVVQRLIADVFRLPKPDMTTELRIYLGLLKKMQDDKFLKSKEFNDVLYTSVELARTGYAEAIEGMAEVLKAELGNIIRKRDLIEKIWQTPDFKALLVQSLIERFSLPDYMRPYMALSSAWESIPYLADIIRYYKERVIERLVEDRKAKQQDFLDLEQMICGTRMNRFVTNNTHDFQKFQFLAPKLWTLEEFCQRIGFSR